MYYLGRVANSKVYSDYCVYSVFDGYDGVRKYVVYNFDSSSRTVSFYDVSNGSYIGSLVVGGYSMAVSSSLVILGDTILPEILDISLVDGSTVYGEVNNKMYGYKVRSYPNPFVIKKDVVEIRFKLDDVKDVRDIEVVVYDSLGRVVKELEVEDKGGGRYMSIWDGKDKENNYVKSGIYFCKVRYKNKKDMYTKIVCVK
jgi:hypothetical protein